MKYTMGADFGTLSVRVLIADVSDGREIATAERAYPHGVMSSSLPDGTALPPDFALQHPADYLDCLREAAHEALSSAGILSRDIIGFGLDCTADTCLPVDASGQPLCLQDAFSSEPHAWVKLWKHHGAEAEAREIREAASGINGLLDPYGGRVFSEWMLPKLLETCRKAPKVIRAADRFLQIGDWIVSRLTGSDARSASHAGFKNFYGPDGYPPLEWLRSLHPLLENFPRLTRGTLLKPGQQAGGLNSEGAALLGLQEGTAVAVSGTDAFHPMPALGLTDSGDLLMSIGTSTCHILVSEEKHFFPGICGVVRDGIIPGLYGYEAGQSCTGDLFAQAVRLVANQEIRQEADTRGVSLHTVLTERASLLRPGQSGLVALDWWNGSRSPYMNAGLTGLIVGLTLDTRPEEIYRALIEANAFGTRVIMENFREHGLNIRRVFACGGISRKNPMLMQIFADVLGTEIHVADSSQTAALGSAVFAAAAAGSSAGGYGSVKEAASAMKCTASVRYTPAPAATAVYDRLYMEYARLAKVMAEDPASPMACLRKIREDAASVYSQAARLG